MIPFSPPDYELTKLIGENPQANLWLAEQISVRRKVIIEQLRNPTPEIREPFFAAVRAKAAMDHPLVASVIEAVNDANYCFYAREWLPGQTLQDLINNGETLTPARAAHILKRIAESQIHNEQRATATYPLTLNDIFIDEQNVMRLANLAIGGARVDETSRDDLYTIGKGMPVLIRPTAAGASRITTLLAWMTGTVSDHIVTWTDVRYYADQIEQQLASSAAASLKPIAATTQKKKKTTIIPWILGVVGIVLIAVAAIIFIPKKTPKPVQKAAILPIKVPAAEYTNATGQIIKSREFWLSAHEVTIQEYQKFLDALGDLKEQERKAFDHESQPAQKKDHLPEDWQEVLSFAKENKVWNSRKLSLESPVFGVDWWDAYAYCEWKRGRLPAQEEWDVALRMEGTDVANLKPLAWSDFSQQESTPAGFTGMAGGVKEWLRKPGANPSNPLAPPQWMLAGASSINPKGGATNLTYLVDRSTRNDDFGIRVAFDHQPD